MRNCSTLLQLGMRCLVTLVCCSLGTLRGMAQEEGREYVPFVEEGKVWYCGYWHPFEDSPATFEDPLGNCIDCIFTMRGDTLINDREYKKVSCQFEEYYGDKEQHHYCAVREEDCRVFIVEGETTEEKLLYDFSHSAESVPLTFSYQQLVRLSGYRRYNFLPGQMEYEVCLLSESEIDYSNAPGFWVDGVGAPFTNPFAFEYSMHIYDQPKLGKDISVRSCIKDGEYVFNEDWMSMPIETSIDERNHTDNSPKDSYIYDLQGRRLTSKPAKGLYIQNGRKMIAK